MKNNNKKIIAFFDSLKKVSNKYHCFIEGVIEKFRLVEKKHYQVEDNEWLEKTKMNEIKNLRAQYKFEINKLRKKYNLVWSEIYNYEDEFKDIVDKYDWYSIF